MPSQFKIGRFVRVGIFACADLCAVAVISVSLNSFFLFFPLSGLLRQRRQVARDIQHKVWVVCPNVECCYMEPKGPSERAKCPNSAYRTLIFIKKKSLIIKRVIF